MRVLFPGIEDHPVLRELEVTMTRVQERDTFLKKRGRTRELQFELK